MAYRPSFFFPAVAIGIGLAIGFFKIYGRLTRPAVPYPVAASVQSIVPKIVIGEPARTSAAALQAPRWIAHLGFVGHVPGNTQFDVARLYVGSADLSSAQPPSDAPLEAVELLSSKNTGWYRRLGANLEGAFRGPPKRGCISPGREELPYREVSYWVTPNDRGGVALIFDYDKAKEPRHPDLFVWSMFAWRGPFRGSETLHARFDARDCFTVAGL